MDRHKAIRNVYPNARRIDDGEGAFDNNGNQINLDESKISLEMERLKTEYEANQYQRDRLKEYNAIGLGEQLDMIYHDIDGWKAKIKAVKDKYPKLK
jgi:hypothetical protein|tara:strand:+ start:182 stop:472 length:291 start_codon:yes stop_codon:yes gene_type:complete